MYTSLVCMPMSMHGGVYNHEDIFGETKYENEASAIVTDVFNLTRTSLKHRLDSMAKLSANWDGYGAPAISKPSIARCKSMISLLSVNIDVILTQETFPYHAEIQFFSGPGQTLIVENLRSPEFMYVCDRIKSILLKGSVAV